jgi:hypothetical protein
VGSLEALSRLLYRFDPLHLAPCGAPGSEYHPEAETILARLPACQSADALQTMVHEEFTRWFGAGVAGDRRRYLAVSMALWMRSK